MKLWLEFGRRLKLQQTLDWLLTTKPTTPTLIVLQHWWYWEEPAVHSLLKHAKSLNVTLVIIFEEENLGPMYVWRKADIVINMTPRYRRPLRLATDEQVVRDRYVEILTEHRPSCIMIDRRQTPTAFVYE